MRGLMMTAVLVSALPIGAIAQATQQRATPGIAPTPVVRAPLAPRPLIQPARWGDRYQGRWHAGYRAPGGWTAYRRPVRGFGVPRYWIQPSFYIADFAGYGLGAPPQGYGWYRYYDDAVLIDQAGYVHDSVAGVEWNRDGRGYVDRAEPYRDTVYAARATDDAPMMGTVAGAAINRANDRGPQAPPPPPSQRRGADYAAASVPIAAPLRADVRYGERGEVVQPLPGTMVDNAPGTVTTRTYRPRVITSQRTVMTTAGYVANGYYYPPVMTTTITYGQPATTTVSEGSGRP
ncbi:RcnB family protein [Sphingomonas qomolangmaensis]|uniref:RcnB family protein n=1 Tax=Sphingomonas qomolangmaensis TaxID=2918765 RepID=A0ABY5LA40_9SPHN|nr:RcnB family protein [Sphingomonas qomolangmaensis]UUL82727.1 RcnB family protein [Sphingomonas qomolangmaensis]